MFHSVSRHLGSFHLISLLASRELSSSTWLELGWSASLLTGSKVEEEWRAIYFHVFSVCDAEVTDLSSAYVPLVRI